MNGQPSKPDPLKAGSAPAASTRTADPQGPKSPAAANAPVEVTPSSVTTIAIFLRALIAVTRTPGDGGVEGQARRFQPRPDLGRPPLPRRCRHRPSENRRRR